MITREQIDKMRADSTAALCECELCAKWNALFDMVDDVSRARRVGEAVIEALGSFVNDPDSIDISEEINISDDGEADCYRSVIIISDEQLEILRAIAEAIRSEP